MKVIIQETRGLYSIR